MAMMRKVTVAILFGIFDHHCWSVHLLIRGRWLHFPTLFNYSLFRYQSVEMIGDDGDLHCWLFWWWASGHCCSLFICVITCCCYSWCLQYSRYHWYIRLVVRLPRFLHVLRAATLPHYIPRYYHCPCSWLSTLLLFHCWPVLHSRYFILVLQLYVIIDILCICLRPTGYVTFGYLLLFISSLPDQMALLAYTRPFGGFFFLRVAKRTFGVCAWFLALVLYAFPSPSPYSIINMGSIYLLMKPS